MNEWNDLVIERRLQPEPLDDQGFLAWMRRQRIFVSSTMDSEMRPIREAVREWIRSHGASPIMWEELVPRDQRADDAYLEGVEGSTIYLLLAGNRYGTTDRSGYSPTHKEGNRAKDLGLPRLVFATTAESEARDGKLNDWLNSLKNELSIAYFDTIENLLLQLESRLCEIAGNQESLWIKLGRLVFPGSVRHRSRSTTGTEFTVRARVHSHEVRRCVLRLGSQWGSEGADRLTWGTETRPIRVRQVEGDSARVSRESIEIQCDADDRRSDDYPMTVTYGSAGPTEQAIMWARQAVLGEEIEPKGSWDMLATMTEPRGPRLPEVLAHYNAKGWLAEGLTRLYLLEGLMPQFGGHFQRLTVGPATASAVRLEAEFVPSGHDRRVAAIQGIIPLP